MGIVNFKELPKVCKAKGLQYSKGKNGNLWKGMINGKYVVISIHKHAEGRDIPTGTFRKYVKQLGFNNPNEFFDFLKQL